MINFSLGQKRKKKSVLMPLYFEYDASISFYFFNLKKNMSSNFVGVFILFGRLRPIQCCSTLF